MTPRTLRPDVALDASWCIVIPEQAPSAIACAAHELADFFKLHGLALKTVTEREAPASRAITLSSGLDGPQDGYNVRCTAEAMAVAGMNPRSVLYGVYRLMDWLHDASEIAELDVSETAHFVERWMPATLHGRTDDARAMRYLARLGVNTAYLRGRRDAFIEVKHLTHYVAESTALPQISAAAPPNKQLLAMAEGACRRARERGFDVVMFQDEPEAIEGPDSVGKEVGDGLPSTLLDELPPEMIGTAHCMRYRTDGWKALSVFHPKVEAHYEALFREVMKRFPELRTLYLYNEDAGSANVWPPTEPHAKDAYPAGYDGYPYAAHLHLAALFQRVGREFRPDFRVATITYHWYQPDDLRRKMVAGLPEGSVLITLGTWDDSIETSVLPAWTLDLIKQTRERGGITLMADDDFNGTCDDLLMEVTAGFPMPIRTWKKLNAWARAGVSGITQHHTGGPTLGVNAITDLAFRVFSWRPLVDADEAEREILRLWRRQLGSDAAADAMMQACRKVECALDAIEADLPNRPYCSRLHHSWRTVTFPPHLADGLKRTGPSTAEYCGDGINPRAWRAMLAKEVAAYEEALAQARRAVEAAPEDQQPMDVFYEP